MTGFLSSANALWAAVGLLAVAALVAVIMLIVPGPPRVPLSRRRMGAAPPQSPLAGIANAATGSVDRLLRGRGGGATVVLEKAGVKLPLRDLIVVVASAMLAAFAIGLAFGKPLVALLLAVLVPILARLVLVVLTGRRQAAFADQLEESLQIISGSLRAGYSLPQAVATVAHEAAVPTSEEFARVVNETRVGRPLDEALFDAAVRVKNEDFYWVTQAIAINREVGGNLADVLDGVGQTIRQRSQLRRQVKALSAEGKLSAIILALLPFVLLLLISLSNPSYIGLLFTTGIGILMLIVAAVLLIVGILWLRKTVQIKF